MLKKKTFLLGLVFVVLLVCSFMAGGATAQQSNIPLRGLGDQALPAEQATPYGFPRSWGGLHSVTTSGVGFAYFFVAADGTVRVVQANLAGIAQINVIPPR